MLFLCATYSLFYVFICMFFRFFFVFVVFMNDQFSLHSRFLSLCSFRLPTPGFDLCFRWEKQSQNEFDRKTRVINTIFLFHVPNLMVLLEFHYFSLILHLVLFFFSLCYCLKKKRNAKQTRIIVVSLLIQATVLFLLFLSLSFCCYCSWFYINLIFIQTNMMGSVELSR